MACPIIAAVRTLQLKESLLHTAQELAHRASIYGVVRVSNTYMGGKCHCSSRTFQRHVVKLEQAHILKKTVTKTLVQVKVGDRMETRLRNEVNTYTFTIPWTKPSGPTLPIDTMSSNLPPQEREKNASLREELANQRKAVRAGWVSPGSERWEAVNARMTYLEGLLAATGGVS